MCLIVVVGNEPGGLLKGQGVNWGENSSRFSLCPWSESSQIGLKRKILSRDFCDLIVQR
jgi:hypothetical protein